MLMENNCCCASINCTAASFCINTDREIIVNSCHLIEAVRVVLLSILELQVCFTSLKPGLSKSLILLRVRSMHTEAQWGLIYELTSREVLVCSARKGRHITAGS